MNFKKPYVSKTPLESFPWLRPSFFCFFFDLLTLGIFIGGRDFISHIIQTLFTDHSFTPSFVTEKKNDNHLKKIKDNALNDYVINEL